MGSRRPAVAVLIALVVPACASTPQPPRPSRPGADAAHVPVTRITDGDTVHVTYQGRNEPLRLIGVNAPEVAWYGSRGECFGPEAGRYTETRLTRASVRLGFDVALRDRYRRLLAYVYIGDELFNLTLVRLGYARADPVPPDVRMAGAFASAQADAHAAGRGLWSACPDP